MLHSFILFKQTLHAIRALQCGMDNRGSDTADLITLEMARFTKAEH